MADYFSMSISNSVAASELMLTLIKRYTVYNNNNITYQQFCIFH